MDDIILADPDKNILERMFDEVKNKRKQNKIPCLAVDWKSPLKGVQNTVSINNLGYKISLQNVRPQKM